MYALMDQLFEFFGLNLEATTIVDYIPWLFKVLLSIGLVFLALDMIRDLVKGVQGRWR